MACKTHSFRLEPVMINKLNDVATKHDVAKTTQVQLGLLLLWQKYGWISPDELKTELYTLVFFDKLHT